MAVSNHGMPNWPLPLNVGDNRCGGNDRLRGFYAAKWSGSSEDTEFALSGGKFPY